MKPLSLKNVAILLAVDLLNTISLMLASITLASAVWFFSVTQLCQRSAYVIASLQHKQGHGVHGHY